jgi:hypothetical protein
MKNEVNIIPLHSIPNQTPVSMFSFFGGKLRMYQSGCCISVILQTPSHVAETSPSQAARAINANSVLQNDGIAARAC